MENHKGLLVINKPEGVKPLSVVKTVRKIYQTKNVGHGGALDPFASGVFIILVGSYVKITNIIHELEKGYFVEICVGVVSDTFDSTGKILRTETVSLSERQVKECLKKFEGKILQRPPLLSSVKIKGKPAYSYFFKGQQVDIPVRETEVYKIDLLGVSKNRILVNVLCGKGFYVRSFANDLGLELGYCGGIVDKLCRFKVGPFLLESAIPYSELNHDTPLADLLNFRDFDQVFLDRLQISRLYSGDVSIRNFIGNKVKDRISILVNQQTHDSIGICFKRNGETKIIVF